jgi:MFS family permease
LSDWWGKRKPLTVMGYAIGALSKPLFAIASTVDMVVTARVLDRVGKGIRGAPRDALIADMVPPEMRGAAFGLRQSLDTVGAFLGPMLGIALMLLWANNFQAFFWVAVIPAGLCVLLLIFGVQEPERAAGAPRPSSSIRENWRSLERRYWWVVALGALFTLARFSEAFLVLRAHQEGLALAWTPAVLIAMNLVYSALAYPFGKLSDRIQPHMLLGAGLLVLIGADLLLAQGGWAIWPGIALWGVQMAMTQGLMSAMVAGSAPEALRGTAYGLFNLVSGLALIIASGLAGLLWDRLGAPATFMAGAGISAAAFLLLWFMRPLIRVNRPPGQQ